MKIRAEQGYLLRSILEKTDAWVDHFRAWEKTACIENLDASSFDLLPMLYYKLSTGSVETPLYSKLQGIYRYTWSSNVNRFALLSEILSLACQLEIPTLLIKGAALSFSHYPYTGLRRMGDFDLVVREEKLELLLKALLQKGFRPSERFSIEKTFLSSRYRRLEHGLSLTYDETRHIDLHWHILDECCFREADDFFWDRAVALNVQGVMTKTLHPTDHLFLLAVHGMQSHNLRWIVDAHLILEKSREQIDWRRLCEKAIDWNLTLPLIHALSILQEYGKKDLDEPIKNLLSHPVSFHTRAEHRNRTTPPKNLWNMFSKHWFKHCRRERNRSLLRNAFTLGGYFKDRYGASNYFALGLEAGRILRRRWNKK